MENKNLLKIVVNNYRWYIDLNTNLIYEYEDSKNPISKNQFTRQEQQQIKDQIKYRNT